MTAQSNTTITAINNNNSTNNNTSDNNNTNYNNNSNDNNNTIEQQITQTPNTQTQQPNALSKLNEQIIQLLDNISGSSPYKPLQLIWQTWKSTIISNEQNQRKIKCENWFSQQLPRMLDCSNNKKPVKAHVILNLLAISFDLLVLGNQGVRRDWLLNKSLVFVKLCVALA